MKNHVDVRKVVYMDQKKGKLKEKCIKCGGVLKKINYLNIDKIFLFIYSVSFSSYSI